MASARLALIAIAVALSARCGADSEEGSGSSGPIGIRTAERRPYSGGGLSADQVRWVERAVRGAVVELLPAEASTYQVREVVPWLSGSGRNLLGGAALVRFDHPFSVEGLILPAIGTPHDPRQVPGPVYAVWEVALTADGILSARVSVILDREPVVGIAVERARRIVESEEVSGPEELPEGWEAPPGY